MSRIRIGWCEKDISTDKPVNIPGQFHMRISQGLLDSLTTTALVIKDGAASALFLSVDCVVIRSSLYDLVIEKIKAKNAEIPAENLLMNATHTHEGASHYYDKVTHAASTEEDIRAANVASSDEYREFLAEQCSDAIVEAWEKADEGSVCWGYGFAVVAQSRRSTYLIDEYAGQSGSGFMINGTSVMYGNTNNKNFAGYESGADAFCNLLYTFDNLGNLTGAIVNVPCPSQNTEAIHKLSGDYWADVRAELRRRHGEHIKVLAQCAAAGDLSPRILHYKAAQQRRFKLKFNMTDIEMAARKDIALRIADCFDEVLSWSRKDLRTEAVIKNETKEFKLARRRITEQEYEDAKAALEKLGPIVPKTDGTPLENINYNSHQVTERNRFKGIVRRYETFESDPTLPMLAHIIRIGDIAFASNRFELYMDFMHRIQARSPFEQTFIVQLAGVPGDEGGSYLATTKGVAGKGYSACHFDNIVSPEGGQELVEQTLEVLNEIAQ